MLTIMNFADTEEFHLTEDVQDIERKLCNFYLEIVMEYFDLDENFIWIENEIPSRWKQGRKKFVPIIKDPRQVLLFSIEDTCLGLRKFYASFMEYVEVTNYLSKKTPIKMYCVHGNSFFASLGICIVIDEAVQQYALSDKKEVKVIQLTVTEGEKSWGNLCSFIVNKFNFISKNIEIKLEFINGSSSRLSADLISRINDTDILVMTRFLSKFNYLTVNTRFLEVILKSLKELSILFYLDVCENIYYEKLKYLISKTKSLAEISSKKTTYESLENAGNREYYLKFPLLFNTAFETVIFSTCIKCSELKDNDFDEKDVKENAAIFKDFKKEMKIIISERFKKENSVLCSTSELENLTISSKCCSNISTENSAQESVFKRKNVLLVSKSSSKMSVEKILPVSTPEAKTFNTTSKCSSKMSVKKNSAVNVSKTKNLFPICSSKIREEKISQINISEENNLIISSKCSSDILVQEKCHNNHSKEDNATKSSQKCDNKSNSLSESNTTSSRKKKKTKLLKQCCKDGRIVRPPPTSATFKQLNAEMFKKETLNEKLSNKRQ